MSRKEIPPLANPYILPLAILLSGAMIAGAILYTQWPGRSGGALPTATAPAPAASPGESREVVVEIAEAPRRGRATAPLMLIEFSDYQCPFCARHVRETWPQIEREYVRTGKVQYVFKDFPLERIHPQAFRAAEAAHCAGEQGKFWEMHDRLFADQAALSAGDFRRLAEELRMDLSRFQACMESGRYAARIRRDLAEGNRLGITGTPTFLLGFTPSSGAAVRAVKIIRGAKSFSEFQQAIEELLAKR